MTAVHRAAVIGLGRIGSRFDAEPGRLQVWSHVGAYLACPDRYRLVGACDPALEARTALGSRCPAVPVFETVPDLLARTRPTVVSICTPAATHARVLDTVLEAAEVRAVWCEKPLAASLADGERMVAACAREGVTLVVSHVRRWAPLWRRFRERILDGSIGTLRCLRIAMPNRLWSIGSHAVDLALWLGGPVEAVTAIDVAALDENGEPARPALLALHSGGYAILQVTGLRRGLIVEAEAIGDRGRLALREDRNAITLEAFALSEAYQGYDQLGEAEVEPLPAAPSPFVAIGAEIADNLDDPGWRPTCDGPAALAVQRVLEKLDAPEVLLEALG
ncbi:MAG: Gfo/Idh/MocA family oxidoreductase [Alphaproteobacteria bacterium]|jgi:predicted dehydrogenase|nr:Gfo/Idh/MocA family oxidoreductase [Alphaproteobacteria bacterium]MDP6515400.1 Gfo/Idh/MocA family oxidoreductase [Alphaproteobacteria bacterium]